MPDPKDTSGDPGPSGASGTAAVSAEAVTGTATGTVSTGAVSTGAAPAGSVSGEAGDAAADGGAAVPASPDVPETAEWCCSCQDPDCVVPGAHPFDPVLLAATTDARMVRWWWTRRPAASVILATGGRAPCGLSLPAIAGARALAEFDRLGVRLGPVVATPTRFTLLVAPYELEQLGELLYAHDWVPSSLRFHGEGGYVALPPSPTLTGRVRWERRPVVERTGGAWRGAPGEHTGTAGQGGREEGSRGGPGAAEGVEGTHGTPWLPRMETLLDVLIEASAAVPDTGSRLAY